MGIDIGGEDEASFHGSDEEDDDDEPVSFRGINEEKFDINTYDANEDVSNNETILDLDTELEMLLEEDFASLLASVDLPLLVVDRNETTHIEPQQNHSLSSSTAASPPLPLHAHLQGNQDKIPSIQSAIETSKLPKIELKQSAVKNKGRQSQGITHDQIGDLRQLLRTHFQLLVQQAVLATRSASFLRQKYERDRVKAPKPSSNNKGFLCTRNKIDTENQTSTSNTLSTQMGMNSTNFIGNEVPDELAETLDASIGMLQELDEVCISMYNT